MPRFAPPIALAREQRLNTAQAGNALTPTARPSPAEQAERRALRTQLRTARRTLVHTPQDANQRICARLKRTPELRRGTNIAAYLSTDGEVNLRALVEWALERSAHVYLPIIRPGNTLRFARYRPNVPLERNRFGIFEPSIRRGAVSISPRRLDVVLMPLVGFDARGNRLGMGGGYYDRTFAFMHGPQRWARPRLIGIAYEIQRVPAIANASWDIPLCKVVTERQIYTARRGTQRAIAASTVTQNGDAA